jgi:predicted Zn-dependent protease
MSAPVQSEMRAAATTVEHNAEGAPRGQDVAMESSGRFGYNPTPPMTQEQRIDAFRAFVAKSPDDAFARYSLAMALRTAGRTDEAIAEFFETARRKPDYVPSYLMLGQVLEAGGRDGEAARAYEDGIAAATRTNDMHARSELSQALDAIRARGA